MEPTSLGRGVESDVCGSTVDVPANAPAPLQVEVKLDSEGMADDQVVRCAIALQKPKLAVELRRPLDVSRRQAWGSSQA
jgi:hypothetical protein